jgi:hypothetical protein
MTTQQNTRNIVLGVLGAVGAVGIGLGLAYYFFNQEPLSAEAQKLIALIKQTIHQNGGHLNKQSLIMIQELMGELSQSDYTSVMMQGRTKRRQPGITDAEYEEIVKDTSKGIEKMVDKNLDISLDLVGVGKEAHELAFIKAVREDYRVAIVGVRILEELRKLLPKSPDAPKMTVELAREVLRFQVIMWPQINIEVKDPEYASIVKQARLADITVEKFKVEEEGITSDPFVRLDQECLRLSGILQELIQVGDNSVLIPLEPEES